MSDLSNFQNPRFARAYERVSREAEARGTARHRERALAGLTGRVIEIGAGNGLNFPHYPGGVTEVVAVEPENLLRASAERAAASSAVPVRVVPGHAGALPADDAGFDAAVLSLVLCSLPSPAEALAEVRRVLRPGGELHFFEHVRSERRLLALFQDLIKPVWRLGSGGCHLNRDSAGAIRTAGFEIKELDRFSYAPLRLVPPHSHILGTAQAPH
ncbi:class I SAM-dependent methyltransferase [Actinomadura rugatobispora]|uniref:Class I SAM-dependent methyltransferase n=1 Tax=Actinomadura rugatobispora TaxID=1994 RepID=A0ABW0ZQN1_9ACTN|nr:class I SAM-dependent methyltransferase [Actinomadura rugatobispora]